MREARRLGDAAVVATPSVERSRLLERAPIRLFLTSATLLFVELVLIRWIPANVTYISFFANFILMASFLGIGLGILAGRRWGEVGLAPFAVLFAIVVVLVTTAQLNVQVRSQSELVFGIAVSHAADVNALVLPLVFALVTVTMAALALPLGGLLRSMPPLRAYGIDIAGSMVGVAAFTALSSAATDPLVWFGVIAVLVTLLSLGQRVRLVAALVPLSMALAVVFVGIDFRQGDTWSPYYRISTYVSSCGLLNVNVNGIPHQALHPVEDRSEACAKEPFYDQVYEWFPNRTFGRVLVIGAGTGTDVAIALDRGANHVDAVEIDPSMQALGSKHPDRPYDDPRVAVHINDGRAFLNTTDEAYDLIIFAQTDSLTLVSSAAGVRLESFLFTSEAFASAREHLAPDGVFALYNYYREPWLLQKLATMLEDTFGQPPLFWSQAGAYAALASGPTVKAQSDPSGPTEVPDAGPPTPKIPTDDWPFPYLRVPGVAPYYLAAIAFVLLFSLVSVRVLTSAARIPFRRFSPHFFVLGAAFLLLETRSLVTFSLLFGTTWLVNSLVFFAILGSVLLAILVNASFPIRRPFLLYAALFVSLGIALVLPPAALLLDPPWLRYLLVSVVAFAPIFCANLVFTHSFRETTTADMAFASNVLGAVLGGCLEYVALLTGYRALLVLVIVLYALAWLFAGRVRLLADRALAPASVGPV
jgi:SAM-dependent methyltransferase